MSRVNLGKNEKIDAQEWIKENHPENGLFKVYWKDVTSPHSGGASFKDEGEGLRYEWYYKDGKMADGKSRGWFPTKCSYRTESGYWGGSNQIKLAGKLKIVRSWKDGKPDGSFTEWYENGYKKSEEHWKNGFPGGHWKRWGFAGNFTEEKIWKEGQIFEERHFSTLELFESYFHESAENPIGESLKLSNKNLKILDCTIRDGGYLNKWRFSDKQVISCFDAASKAGFDYVELGFKSSNKKFNNKNYGKWFFCNEKDLRMVFDSVKNPAKISIMVRPENINLTEILPAKDSVVEMVRVVVNDKSCIERACKYVQKLKDENYKVCLNPIKIDDLDEGELHLYFREVAKQKVDLDYFYFPDTYGSMDIDKVNKLKKIFNIEYLSHNDYPTKIGFHSHNNLQNAIMKSSNVIERGIDIIDSCMFGLGRGPGNLCSELLINELQKIDNIKYDILPILEYINEHIHHYKNNTKNELDCRYNIVYVMTGILMIHPDYGEHIINMKKNLSVREIWDIFQKLVKFQKNKKLDIDYLNELQ
jgi:4-hydroxy 2-oxovalerate aldolase